MAAIIADTGPAPCPKTSAQSVSTTRRASTRTEKAPKSQAAQVAHLCTALMPRPEIAKLATTKSSSVTTISAVPLRTSKRMSRTLSSAYAPVTALIVSQPQRATQISAPGSRLPRCPNTARDSAMPGAPPRLPAIPISPTKPYDTIGAVTPTTRICQKPRPYETDRPAPMVRSRTLMLAAAQVGKSSRVFAVRSASGICSRPWTSRPLMGSHRTLVILKAILWLFSPCENTSWVRP